jgi:hypothetical protein
MSRPAMSRPTHGPPDRALQPERTELSWRRTLLALTVASVVSFRVLSPALGAGAIIVGSSGLAAVVVLAAWSELRIRRMHHWFHHVVTGTEPADPAATCGPPAGALLFSVAVFVTAAAVLGLVLVAENFWSTLARF